jgi:signal transduction histidine kinase/ActR/RegA family two-component response regulator
VFPDNPDDIAANGVSSLRASFDFVRERLLPHTLAVQKFDIRRPAEEGGGFEERYWSPINAPVLDHRGELRFIINRVEDVTELVRLQERGRDTSPAAASQQASGAKNEFLSRMSHELRTPLNAVLGFAQLLQMDELDTAQAESVHEILKAGRLLLALIDEVLDISRIEAGTLTISLEPVDVSTAVEEAASLIRPLAADRSVTVDVVSELSGAAFARADRQRIKQVALNLLSNAVKYNREGGLVRVTITGAEDRVQIVVQDSGGGIAADKLDRLFEPFERLGAEHSDVEGTGLGLALAKRLTEAMGGSISVDSRPGEGTNFVIELVAAEAPDGGRLTAVDALVAPDIGGGPSGQQCRILYIEDNLSNLTLVERILGQQAAELIPAMQGRLGLELARQHNPDLIVLDLHLPDMNGEEVLRRLKADPATREVPVVVLSAEASKKHVARLLRLGSSDYLTKPLDVPRFLEVIATHVNLRGDAE